MHHFSFNCDFSFFLSLFSIHFSLSFFSLYLFFFSYVCHSALPSPPLNHPRPWVFHFFSFFLLFYFLFYIDSMKLIECPFSFRSGHELIVVDIQGVGDLYTDPQIHTAKGKAEGFVCFVICYRFLCHNAIRG